MTSIYETPSLASCRRCYGADKNLPSDKQMSTGALFPPSLTLVVAGVIPEECTQMSKLEEFKVADIRELTSESVGFTTIARTIFSEIETYIIQRFQTPL